MQRATPKTINFEQLKILCIVASVAVLELGVDEKGLSKLQTNDPGNLQSSIWYPNCKPFDPKKMICLDHINSNAEKIPWGSIQFENCQAFKECLYKNRSTNFFTLENLRNGAADVYKHCENDQRWKDIVSGYLEPLVEDHAYEIFMEAFETTRGGTPKESHRHGEYGFNSQDFLSALKAEIDSKVKHGSGFCKHCRLSTGKRPVRNADSSLTGADGNSTVKKKNKSNLGEPSTSNACRKKLSYDDNEGPMSTGITPAASALGQAPPDGQIEVESQPQRDI